MYRRGLKLWSKRECHARLIRFRALCSEDRLNGKRIFEDIWRERERQYWFGSLNFLLALIFGIFKDFPFWFLCWYIFLMMHLLSVDCNLFLIYVAAFQHSHMTLDNMLRSCVRCLDEKWESGRKENKRIEVDVDRKWLEFELLIVKKEIELFFFWQQEIELFDTRKKDIFSK